MGLDYSWLLRFDVEVAVPVVVIAVRLILLPSCRGMEVSFIEVRRH